MKLRLIRPASRKQKDVGDLLDQSRCHRRYRRHPRLGARPRPRRTIRAGLPSPFTCPTRPAAQPISWRACWSPKFSEQLGQNFIVENVEAGATTIATGRVARATADGPYVRLHNLQISANVSLHANLPFGHREGLGPDCLHHTTKSAGAVGRKVARRRYARRTLIVWMRPTPGPGCASRTGSTGI